MIDDSEGPLWNPGHWCALSDPERRDALSRALGDALTGGAGIVEVRVVFGPVGRRFDLTAVVETDVGELRAPLWSDTRAGIFCDASIHPANRRQLAPGHAVRHTVELLRPRLAVPYALEGRGLTIRLELEPRVQRTWTAERSLFRGRTAVAREDAPHEAAGDLDLRDLLRHFYTGPALRLVDGEGTPLFLPAAADPEDGAPLSLCPHCRQWSDGFVELCPHCGSRTEPVLALRPARR